MAGKYRAYPEYKDSGLQWLGEIPSTWKIIYSKAVFSERNEKAQSDDEQLTASQKYGILPQKLFMEMEQQKVVQVLKGHEILKKVEVDDFVISMRSFQGGIEYSPYSGSISSAYVPLFAKKNISKSFFKYFLKSAPYIQALQSTTNLVRDGQALRYGNFTQVPLPVFEFDEQENIGKFLDHETAKIDTLIEKQQQLIQLLKEKRQAVISHAVTKGLNPDVPMKDSGVEWLGEVPAHWVVTRLKYHTNLFEQGWSPQCDSRPAEGDEYGVLKVGCVNHGAFNCAENKALPKELEPQLQYLLKKDDLLISRANTKELVGSAAVVDGDYDNLLLCDKLYRIRFDHLIVPQLVAYYLALPIVRQQIELEASGASHSMQNIGQSTIKELPIAIPPRDEADALLIKTQEKVDVFNSIHKKASDQIVLLQERRTALISAAVTGKIDVRLHASHPTGSA